MFELIIYLSCSVNHYPFTLLTVPHCSILIKTDVDFTSGIHNRLHNRHLKASTDVVLCHL